jgi:hypothetical protein
MKILYGLLVLPELGFRWLICLEFFPMLAALFENIQVKNRVFEIPYVSAGREPTKTL